MQAKELIKDATKGAIAGAVATKVMEKVSMTLWRMESQEVREREKQVREKPPYRVAAEKFSNAAGLNLNEAQMKKLAMGFHWGLGIGAGATYGVVRNRLPRADAGQGLAFGTAFFLAADEAMNTAFGFTPPPQEFPWQAHGRGLASHLTFGVVAETVLDAFDRLGGARAAA